MCFYCKCKTTVSSVTTHVVTLENCVIIVKNVPCEECEQCGEKYFTDEVMEQLDLIIDKAQALPSEIFITDYNHRAAQVELCFDLMPQSCAAQSIPLQG